MCTGSFGNEYLFVVDFKSLRKSLNVIHDSFFPVRISGIEPFICGIGTVGGSLVEQIRCQQQKLMMENGLKLHVVGIIDAAKAMFSREGSDLANFREELKEKGKDSNLQTIRDEIVSMNIFNSVFVDCTASPDIASLYKDLLEHNISVVAANKIAASSALRELPRPENDCPPTWREVSVRNKRRCGTSDYQYNQ